MNVSGATKNALFTYLSFILFDDMSFTLPVAIGLGISFVGSIYWIAQKYNENFKPKKTDVVDEKKDAKANKDD